MSLVSYKCLDRKLSRDNPEMFDIGMMFPVLDNVPDADSARAGQMRIT